MKVIHIIISIICPFIRLKDSLKIVIKIVYFGGLAVALVLTDQRQAVEIMRAVRRGS
jgi:hypothetical protein